MARVIFGDWTPDQGENANPGMLNVSNVLPHPRGYQPIKAMQNMDSLSAGTTITVAQLKGAFCALSSSGIPTVYAATNDRIWWNQNATTVWTNISSASASYVSSFTWNFALYNFLTIATSDGVSPQKSTLSATPAIFTDLGGTPPSAVFVGIVRDFVVFLRTTANPALVQWGALGNAQDYVASAVTQSDSQTIADEGPIVGFLGGEYGIIFFQYAAYRMTYIGSPVIFQFDKIAANFEWATDPSVGPNTRAGYQAVRYGDDSYFMTTAGLAVIRSGQLMQFLSKNRNGDYFIRNFGITNSGVPAAKRISPLYLAADRLGQRIVIGFRNTLSSATSVSEVMFYDITLDRFSRATFAADFLFSGNMSEGTGSIQPTQELYFSVGNPQRLQRRGTTGAANIAAFLETSDLQLNPGGQAFVRNVRPIMDGTGAPAISVGTKIIYNQSASYSATVTTNANGESMQRAPGRSHRFRVDMSVSMSWSVMTGIEIDATSWGKR